MAEISSVGNGFYNYYHVKGRTDTTDGKARTMWYDRDLSKEEIGSSNGSTLDRNHEGADLCRKIADTYRGVAESNRAKYRTAQEATDAIYAKYNSLNYSGYSLEERHAMARNEVSMTLYGTVSIYDVRKDPHLHGEVSKNTHSSANENDARNFNAKTLGAQIMNVFRNNGLNTSLINSGDFKFSLNGMTMEAVVLPADEKTATDSSLFQAMTDALNTKDNAKKLFYNLLYDGSKQGILAKDSLAKFKLYSDFKDITGLDMAEFKQTSTGFVDKQGRNATDIYKEALKTTDKVPAGFAGAANSYFHSLVDDAMQYNMAETPDLEVSMELKGGQVCLNSASSHLDVYA